MTIVEELDELERLYLDPSPTNRPKIKELYWSILDQLSKQGRRKLALEMWDAMANLIRNDDEEGFKKAVASVRERVNQN